MFKNQFQIYRRFWFFCSGIYLFSLLILGFVYTVSPLTLFYFTVFFIIATLALYLWVLHPSLKNFREFKTSLLDLVNKNQERMRLVSDPDWSGLAFQINDYSQSLKQQIEKIQAEKIQLQVILESMSEGVLVLGEHSRILLSNSALQKLLGAQSLRPGDTLLEAFREPALQEMAQEVMRTSHLLEREIQVKRGSGKNLLVHATPWKIREQTSGVVFVFHDVTRLRQLENLRKEFVANVSHELKTPLAAIQGYAETLMGGGLQDSETATRFLGVIHRNALRLNSILQDLLDLSRIESSHYQIILEQVQIEGVMDDLQQTFSKRIEEKRLQLEIHHPQLDELWADAKALRHILSNLLDNALKYSPEHGRVLVDWEIQEGRVIVEVKDQGSGIPPEHLSRIFERFYRVDPSRSRQMGGTGLGLSIVKHLVQLQGGEVWAESKLGEGTSIFFSLPQKGI